VDPRIQVITKLMEGQQLDSRISARAAGSILGISEGHFLRLFKREVGTTFRRYRREARITGIADLLTRHAASVKSVARAAGYEDVSNFHRDFKQVRGMSPRQWQLTQSNSQLHSIARLENV